MQQSGIMLQSAKSISKYPLIIRQFLQLLNTVYCIHTKLLLIILFL